MLAAAALQQPRLRILTQQTNQGYAAALIRGFNSCRCDAIFYTDADAQFDLGDLARAYPLLAHADMVAGWRQDRQDSWLRKALAAGFNVLQRSLLGTQARDVDCAFKLFRRSFFERIELSSSGFLIDAELYGRANLAGLRVVQLPVTASAAPRGPLFDSARRLCGAASSNSGRSPARCGRNAGARRRSRCAERAQRTRKVALASSQLVRRTLIAILPAVVLGLAWQGSRGLWEPDEGRNTNIALGMVESGDWLVPRLNDDPYLDKPPLHFWTVAASMMLLGVNEWGARVPNGLFFVATAALVWALGRRMWDQRAGQWSAWVYATTLAPFAAANVVTPDTPLAAFVVLLVYAYWRADCDGHGSGAARCGWWLLAGAAVGLGLLAKGPAMLVFLPPLALHLAVRWRQRAFPLGPGPWLGLVVAAVLGLAWYVAIVRALPDAAAYLLDNQAVGRLTGSKWDRSPGWMGAVKVYLPTIAAGVLPWSFFWLANARRQRRLRDPWSGSSGLLLGLWLTLPLAVFALASSRLPLYLLPLFVPFALLTGRALSLAWSEASSAWRRRTTALLVIWCAVLLGLKIFAAIYPSHRDTRLQAAWIAAQGVDVESELVVVDRSLNGLRLYGYPDLLWVRARGEAYPLFSPLPTLDRTTHELASRGRPAAVVVASQSWVDPVQRQLTAAGFTCEARASDLKIALLLCSPASPADRTASAAIVPSSR